MSSVAREISPRAFQIRVDLPKVTILSRLRAVSPSLTHSFCFFTVVRTPQPCGSRETIGDSADMVCQCGVNDEQHSYVSNIDVYHVFSTHFPRKMFAIRLTHTGRTQRLSQRSYALHALPRAPPRWRARTHSPMGPRSLCGPRNVFRVTISHSTTKRTHTVLLCTHTLCECHEEA